MLSIFFVYLMSMSANAQVRFAPVEGQYQAKGEFQYLATSANYLSSGGSSSSLVDGGKFTRMLGVGEVSYDYSPAIRFWGGFSGGQSTAVVLDTAASTAFTAVTKTDTNSGLNEGYLGAQWWTEYQSFDIIPQADFIFPFWRVNNTSQNPLLGEGAIQVKAGSWVMYPMPDLTPFVYAGIDFRDEGRSMLLPYSIGARYGHPDTFWIQAEFRGYQSLTDDTNANVNGRNIRDAYLLQADGGSYEFYAINPNRSEIAGLAGFQFNQLGIYGGGSKSVFGKGSADDYEIRVGLTFNGTLFAVQKKAASPSDAGFSEKPEKYDDSLFKEQLIPDPEPVYEPEVVTPAAKPAPKRAVKAKPKTPRADAPMPNVELLMKDTQKSLEKKKGN